MSVNMEYYRTFYYVATYKNMGKAAEAMFLTTPTITRAIQLLEKQLDCQLFNRSVKGVSLTAAGEVLYNHVKPSINLLYAGEREISMLNSLEGGRIRVGLSKIASHFLTRQNVLGAFCNMYPKVQLEVRYLSPSAAQADVLSGDIDLAILSLQSDTDLKEFETSHIYTTKNVPVAGTKYAELASEPISLEDLAEHPLIFTQTGFGSREHYERMYHRHGLVFKPAITTPALEIQLEAVKLNLGYSFVPYQHIIESLERRELYLLDILEEKPVERSVCLLTAKDRPMSRAASAFVEIIRSAADEYEKPLM